MQFSIVAVAAVLAAVGPALAAPAATVTYQCPTSVNGVELVTAVPASGGVFQCLYGSISCAFDSTTGKIDSETSKTCPKKADPVPLYQCPDQVDGTALLTSAGGGGIVQCIYGSVASCAYDAVTGKINSETSTDCPKKAVKIPPPAAYKCPIYVNNIALDISVDDSTGTLQCIYGSISCAFNAAKGKLTSATSADCPNKADPIPTVQCPATVNGKALTNFVDNGGILQCLYPVDVSCAYNDTGKGKLNSATSSACPKTADPLSS